MRGHEVKFIRKVFVSMASSRMDNEKRRLVFSGSDDSGPWLEVFPNLKEKNFVRFTVRCELIGSLVEAV